MSSHAKISREYGEVYTAHRHQLQLLFLNRTIRTINKKSIWDGVTMAPAALYKVVKSWKIKIV